MEAWLDDPRRGLAAVLAFTAFWFLLFCAVDRRLPDDHDDFYTADSTWELADLKEASFFEQPGILFDHFSRGKLHPRLAQVTLVGSLSVFGRSRFVYRATNLPFLLLLVAGTWLLARELAGHRFAFLAAFATANVPMVINYSRKWDIQFHAAALTPLGLWLAIAALRSEQARSMRLWLAFGAWQGLRLYTHPIVMPDVVVTMGVVAVISIPHAKVSGKSIAKTLLGVGSAAAACFAVGLYYLGIAGDVIGEPEYSLRRYLVHRGSYSETGWWFESDLLAKADLSYTLLAEVVWLHAMPLLFALLVPGLLLLPLVLLRKSLWAGTEPGLRLLMMLLALPTMAQIPPILLGTSNRAYLNDWVFLTPAIVILAMMGLRAAAVSLGDGTARWSRRWAIALLVSGSLYHALPWGAFLVVGDPIAQPLDYNNLILGPFTRSSSGRHYTTHHVPTRFPFAGTALAKTVAELQPDTTQPARFGLVDLTWDPSAQGSRGCHMGAPEDEAGWSWAPPRKLNVWAREVSPWPFVFEGFPTTRSVRPDHDLDAAASSWSVYRSQEHIDMDDFEAGDEVTVAVVGGDEERDAGTADAPPAPETAPEAETTPEPERTLPRPVVVRLWVHSAPFWSRETFACNPDERLPEGFFDEAVKRAGQRFPEGKYLGTLTDPAGWLVARAVEWDRTRAYIGTALLYDLGEPSAQPAPEPEPEAEPLPDPEGDSAAPADEDEVQLDGGSGEPLPGAPDAG